ncbi:MAG: HlyD family secretion protein [Bacteroidaceae bacterium]|nr:HlyD family secretion protein [Bacteroidaceae bacterium]
MEQKNKSGKILTILGVIILCVGLVWIGALLWGFDKTTTTDDAQVEQYISSINVRASGYIHEIRFTEHQYVHKGDTLLIIDNREHKIRLMEAEAALKDANAGKSVIGATLDRTENSVLVYDSSIEEIQARINKLRKDKTRYENLVKRNAATPIQLEQIETELIALEAKLESVRQQKRTANSSVTEVVNKQASVEAAILRATAAVEMARLNLSYTVVTAPCDGWLGRRALEVGQLVSAGQAITNILPDEQKWIIANYKETQIRNLSVGQKVLITVDAWPNEEFEGVISHISAATGSKYSMVPTDNSAGNFVKIQQRIPVRIDFVRLSEEDNRKLAAGMMAVVKTE